MSRIQQGNFLSHCIKGMIFIMLLAISSINLAAETFLLPEPGNNVVGEIQTVFVEPGDNFYVLAQRYGVGFKELVKANPRLNPWRLKKWQKVRIPTAFILPPYERKGIIINLSEMRLYYYPPHENVVVTAPIAIGRQGWETPLTTTKIIEKKKEPHWFVPESIRAQSAAKGRYLPKVVPPGPKNPLGDYALRLGLRSYLIHGTNNPKSIGKQISSGCIRMYPEDIEYLFYDVPVGTQVRIINEPYKVGWYNGKLYIEAHKPVENGFTASESVMRDYQSVIQQSLGRYDYPLQWDKIHRVIRQHKGYPQRIL